MLLFNLNPTEEIVVRKGDRVAQLLLKKISVCDVEEVDELPSTERGSGGFGSTGGFDRTGVV